MARMSRSLETAALLAAALEGLELQKQRIEQQIDQVRRLLGKRSVRLGGEDEENSLTDEPKPARKRDLSPAARKRIAMAQKKRWAEYRRQAAERKGAQASGEPAA